MADGCPLPMTHDSRKTLYFWFGINFGVHMLKSIPEAIRTFLNEEKLGEITAATTVTGGNVNRISRLETSRGFSCIVKQTIGKQAGLFACEAEGLTRLRKASMRTPDVLSVPKRN